MTKYIEREAFEKALEQSQGFEFKYLIGITFNKDLNKYEVSGAHWCDEVEEACNEINIGWISWQAAKAMKQKKLEGCVVVPIKCPDPDFADLLFDELGKKAIGTFGEDMLIHFSDINEEKIWDLMLEAARGGNE